MWWWLARAVSLAAAAFVPLVVAVNAEDVFSGPKVTTLWVLLIIAWWLVAMGALLGRTDGLRFLRPVPSVDWSILALLLASAVAVLFSVDRGQSIMGERLQHQGVLTLALYLGWFMLARVLFADRRALMTLMAAVTTGAAIVATYALVQRAGLDPVWDGFLPDGRVFATIGQPNALAAYLALAFPCAVAVALGARGARRAVALTASMLIAIALTTTLSRGGYLALGATVVVFGAARALLGHRAFGPGPRTLKTGTVALVVAAAAVAAVVTFSLLPSSRQTATEPVGRLQTLSAASTDESIAAHLDQWRVAARIVADRPVVGTGPATYPLVFPFYSRLALTPDRVAYFDQFRVESAHNVILDLAAGGGIPLAAAWVATMVAVVRRLWVTARRADDAGLPVVLMAVVAVMAGHVVANSFITAEVTGSWLMWLLMGAAVGAASGRPQPSPQTQGGAPSASFGPMRPPSPTAGTAAFPPQV